MAVKFAAVALFLVLTITSILGIAMANKNCTTGGGGAPTWNHTSGGRVWDFWPKLNATTHSSKTITVGGLENNWRYGFNYSDWANNHGPFYFNDTLVFKYDAPNETQPFQHSVYLFKDLRSYQNCDLKRATKIADVKDGEGEGFKFVLTWKMKWPQQPWYYFACGEHDGAHCNDGGMKFAVLPISHPLIF
ncbi:hypothetical protein CASFOL_010729 [Castilleja foliolosa]|uniref:Phytocyanin domain-containing protein n=1 Tax=Castilleja foliolosa TaxID=1961234 RepID=A0ABD3DXH8_9LAMI